MHRPTYHPACSPCDAAVLAVLSNGRLATSAVVMPIASMWSRAKSFVGKAQRA
jgi:hypothetical protein